MGFQPKPGVLFSNLKQKNTCSNIKLLQRAAEILEKQQELWEFVLENQNSSGGVDGRTPGERVDTFRP